MPKFNKHLNKYFLKEKKVYNLKIQRIKIFDAIRHQGYVELEEPYPLGFDAKWVLKQDILKSIDVQYYQEALNIVNISIWSKDGSFKHWDWKGRKWGVEKPGLRKINERLYNSLSPQAKKFFIEDEFPTKYWNYTYKDKYYKCTLYDELEIKVSQSYVTHRQEHEPILYQMCSETEKTLDIITDGCPWGKSRHDKFWYKVEFKSEKVKFKNNIKKLL